jgi:hypothetical protein
VAKNAVAKFMPSCLLHWCAEKVTLLCSQSKKLMEQIIYSLKITVFWMNDLSFKKVLYDFVAMETLDIMLCSGCCKEEICFQLFQK